MTVSATNAFDGPFLGNGATTFPFTFAAQTTDEVGVQVDGTAITSGYSVILNDAGGGSVIFSVPPANGSKIIVFSNPSFDQDIAFGNSGAFFPESHDEANDRAAIRDIKLLSDAERSPKVPLGETIGDLPSLAARKGGYLAFDNITGNPVAVVPPANPPGSNSGINETIYLKDHGIVADGVTVNSAVAVEALIAAQPGNRGATIVFPLGTTLWDRTINILRPCRLLGYGMGNGNSGSNTGSGATLLIFPPGYTGFRIKHANSVPSGQQTTIENMRIAASGVLSTTGTGSFSTGTGLVTLSTGSANFADTQVAAQEAAGVSMPLADRVFTTTSGSPVVTWTCPDGQYRGNSVGYVGQPFSHPNLPAGTTIVSWGIGTLTVSANATASGAGAATIKLPLLFEIGSGGGTGTLHPDSVSFGAQNATATVVRHAACGVMSSTQCHMRNVEVMGFQVGLFLHGNTTGGEVADTCLIVNCIFNTTWIGVHEAGYDAQVNSYDHINCAGPEVGFMGMMFIRSTIGGQSHFSSNCGIMVGSGSYGLIECYFGEGASHLMKPSSSCLFFGGTGLVVGEGLNGIWTNGDKLTMGAADATALSAKSTQIYGGGTGSSGYASYLLPGSATAPWTVVPGNRINLIHDGTVHWHFTTDPWRLDAVALQFWHSATPVARTISNGFDLYSGVKYYVNGTQVVTARRTGWTAPTGTATRSTFATGSVTLPQLAEAVKALIDDLTTHGLIGA